MTCVPSSRERPSSPSSLSPVGPWTLTLVAVLLWSATPISAVPFANVSSSKATDHHQRAPTVSRCAPASHDVLWTRLNLVAPRLTSLSSSNDVDDDVEVSPTHLSLVSDHDPSPPRAFQTTLSDSTQIVVTSTNSRYHQQGRRRGWRRWRRRNGSSGRPERGRPSRGARRTPASQPWSCKLQKRWKRMPSGVFPTYIQTGSCRKQPTCMLGMYSCRPLRYLVKVLRRVGTADDSDDGCRPVPVIGADAVYEEAWSLVDMSATVACECSRRRRSGTYYHNKPTTDT